MRQQELLIKGSLIKTEIKTVTDKIQPILTIIHTGEVVENFAIYIASDNFIWLKFPDYVDYGMCLLKRNTVLGAGWSTGTSISRYLLAGVLQYVVDTVDLNITDGLLESFSNRFLFKIGGHTLSLNNPDSEKPAKNPVLGEKRPYNLATPLGILLKEYTIQIPLNGYVLDQAAGVMRYQDIYTPILSISNTQIILAKYLYEPSIEDPINVIYTYAYNVDNAEIFLGGAKILTPNIRETTGIIELTYPETYYVTPCLAGIAINGTFIPIQIRYNKPRKFL